MLSCQLLTPGSGGAKHMRNRCGKHHQSEPCTIQSLQLTVCVMERRLENVFSTDDDLVETRSTIDLREVCTTLLYARQTSVAFPLDLRCPFQGSIKLTSIDAQA